MSEEPSANVDSIINAYIAKLQQINFDIREELEIGAAHEARMKQLTQEFGFTLQTLIAMDKNIVGNLGIYGPQQLVTMNFQQLVATLKLCSHNQ